jgi:hypothetical protein
MNDNRIYDVSIAEAHYLVDYFDIDEDHKLSYKE